MRVLIVHGSTRGGTAGIAERLRDQLRQLDVQADMRPATEVDRIDDDVDAVIVGGALYANRWHRDARRFVRHHAAALRARPVWLFSSGPLDASAESGDIPPVAQVERAMQDIGARGHVTFGGRLRSDAKGFLASRMARNVTGDWRDPPHIRMWAGEIARDLAGQPA